MSAPKKISDAELESLLRAARPVEPAPLDPDRARAIFEQAIALARPADAESDPAASGATTPPWWARLRAALLAAALPPPPARLAWGAAAGVAFAAVLLVSVAITGSDRPGGGGQGVATNIPSPAASRVPVPGVGSLAPPAAAQVANTRVAAAPDPARPAKPETAIDGGRRQRRHGDDRTLVASAAKPALRRTPRKTQPRRAAEPRPAAPAVLPSLDDELPMLMVASNLPQGEDSERLVITVREDAPADLPGYAEAAALREMPVGPAGPAGVPGAEGPAAPPQAGEAEDRVRIVWAECQVRSGGEPTLTLTPVVAPAGSPGAYEPLPEPVPEPELGPASDREY